MTKLLQIGHAFAAELHDDLGHIAGTLGGVDYECRGHDGCIKGANARGAANSLFHRQHHLVLTDAAAVEAKKYADACIGQPYDYPHVPSKTHGGDCSGYMSGIICAAKGKEPHRLFTTDDWLEELGELGFKPGLFPGLEEEDVNLDDVVYNAEAGNPNGIAAGPRTLKAILAAMDARTSFLVNTDFLKGRLDKILTRVSEDDAHPVTLTAEQITALAQAIAAELPRELVQ